MSVKRFRLKREDIDDNTSVDIPLDMDHQQVDNTDVIETEFVRGEVKKNTNPIIDYDKFRFKPYYNDEVSGLTEIKVVNYNLFFLDGGTHPTPPNVTTYDQIGFTYDDLKFRKNAFTNSFLRINFYDTDVTMDQNLLGFSDLFCSLRVPTDDNELSNSDIDNNTNFPNPINSIPVKFELTNPSLTRSRIHEGVHLFWFDNDLPKELFMVATFNNAKNGISTEFMNTDGQFAIDNLVDKLHTKFILNKMNNTYYYILDDSYSNNIRIETLSNGNKELNIDLYEVNVQ